jgi:hypothetical protein
LPEGWRIIAAGIHPLVVGFLGPVLQRPAPHRLSALPVQQEAPVARHLPALVRCARPRPYRPGGGHFGVGFGTGAGPVHRRPGPPAGADRLLADPAALRGYPESPGGEVPRGVGRPPPAATARPPGGRWRSGAKPRRALQRRPGQPAKRPVASDGLRQRPQRAHLGAGG